MSDTDSNQQEQLMQLVASIKDSTLKVVLADLAAANSKLGQLAVAAQQQQREFEAQRAELEDDIREQAKYISQYQQRIAELEAQCDDGWDANGSPTSRWPTELTEEDTPLRPVES